MKILLVNPNFHSGGPENIVGTLPPLGLLYVGGALINEGYKDVRLIDLCKEKPFADEIETSEYIVDYQPDFVFIGGMASTASTPLTLKISKRIKYLDKEIKIVLGGVHPTFMYKEIMDENPHIDFIIRGEGEIPSSSLVKSYENDFDLNNVRNLVWRDNGTGGSRIKVNSISNEVVNLDDYRPAWDLINDWNFYRTPTTNEITATFQFSRGCSHRCSFCGQWMFWKKWHSMSVESTIEEIDLLNRKYGVTFFFWVDENPAEDQNKWIELLYALKETNEKNNNKNHHMLNTRVNHIIRDEKYLTLYKEAGIISIDLGMESALQQRLDFFNKETTIAQNEHCLNLLRQYDIISIVQVLVGTPDETKETLKETAVMFEKWNPDLMHFYYVTPYPWTKYGKSMKDYIIENDLSKWDYRHPVVKINNISAEEMLKMCKWIKLKFNFNPKKLAKIFQIKDDYRRAFILNSLIQSLKYRSGESEISRCL